MKPLSVLSALVAGLAVAALLIAPAGPVQAQAKKSARIAVALFGPHESLHQVVDGFKQELAARGISATYDEGNVNFDRSLVPQFLNRLAASNPDLMLTVTTPMSQSARQVLAGRRFPIVFAPVTDPVAAKLVPSWDKGDELMTGASNLPDLAATLEFIKALVPGTKRVGILFNPGDDSDVTFVARLDAAGADSTGWNWSRSASTTRATSRYGSSRCRVAPTPCSFRPRRCCSRPEPAIAAAANRIKLPVFNSNTTQVRSHQMLAAYSVDWKKVGINAGAVAAEILNGKPPSDIPVRLPRPEDHEVVISGQRLKDLGLTLPASLKDCNCVIE